MRFIKRYTIVSIVIPMHIIIDGYETQYTKIDQKVRIKRHSYYGGICVTSFM